MPVTSTARSEGPDPDLALPAGLGWQPSAPFHNPGDLAGWTYRPRNTPPNAALVLVLHGCTQSARSHADHAGWRALADQEGLVLLCPEQRRSNNPNLCFNWYEAGDVTRGQGEVASIAAMVMATVDAHSLDPARIFVTGLSAGGAMAGAMLATYPELFAGGAVIAGLPFGAVDGLQQALAAMGHGGRMSSVALGAKVRSASPNSGPWPRISIWHGSQDTIVQPAAGRAVAEQWAAVHGLTGASAQIRMDPHGLEVWRDGNGTVRVELHTISGMAHGTPLMTGGAGGLGRAGPYMLEVQRSSTREIAAFWGLTAPAAGALSDSSDRAPVPLGRPGSAKGSPGAARVVPMPAGPIGVQAVIEAALRSAGLMT